MNKSFKLIVLRERIKAYFKAEIYSAKWWEHANPINAANHFIHHSDSSYEDIMVEAQDVIRRAKTEALLEE